MQAARARCCCSLLLSGIVPVPSSLPSLSPLSLSLVLTDANQKREEMEEQRLQVQKLGGVVMIKAE